MILLFIFLGLLPSLAWLGIYLRQDAHPEPKKMVLSVFLLGMAAAFIAATFEFFFLCSLLDAPSTCASPEAPAWIDLLPNIHIAEQSFWGIVLGSIIGIAFAEELVKFLVVRWRVLRSPAFDEPVDAMIYLIIAALGFAAVENIFTILQEDVRDAGLGMTLRILLFRSLGATFLHTLSSGIVGYFLARSFFVLHPSALVIIPGLLLATATHWLYNAYVTDIVSLTAEGTEELHLSSLNGLILLLGVTGVVIFLLLKHLRAISLSRRFQVPAR